MPEQPGGGAPTNGWPHPLTVALCYLAIVLKNPAPLGVPTPVAVS